MAEGGSDSAAEPLGMRAVIIGATGAIGQCLLGELLSSKNIQWIKKLKRNLEDWSNMS